MANNVKKENGTYELRIRLRDKLNGTSRIYTKSFRIVKGMTGQKVLTALDDEIKTLFNK